MLAVVCHVLLSVMVTHQAQYIEIKVVDGENQTPIEGVYVQQNNNFWYSDKDGIVKIDEKQITQNDIIHFSHLSYKPINVQYNTLSQSSTFPILRLESDLKILKEVTISAVFDAAKYVEGAIKQIPSNYSDPFSPSLNLSADIDFDRIDEPQELIRFKGILHFVKENKNEYVGKIPEIEVISPDLEKNIFFIQPYQALEIISIKYHHVIRKHKRYNFYNYEFIEYKGSNAVKIYFKEKGSNPCIGHLVIDRDTKAILSVYYSVENVETRIIGTMKGKGVVKTAIDRYIVETDYIQTDSGKYIFDSGRENIDSNNRWKENKVYTSSNIFLKRNTDSPEFTGEKKKIKELF